jgi:hypothetical protein
LRRTAEDRERFIAMSDALRSADNALDARSPAGSRVIEIHPADQLELAL